MKKALLIFCILISCYLFKGQVVSPRFVHYSKEQGLASREVRAIVQDSTGILWIGTREGLIKYDASKFTSYKHDPDDKKSIIGDFIKCLMIDMNNNVWIGTTNGLSIYDRKSDYFINYTKNKNSIGNNLISSICQDKGGTVWISHWDGLSKCVPDNINNLRFSSPKLSDNDKDSRFLKLIENPSGILWVISNKLGLFYSDNSGDSFKKCTIESRIPPNGVHDIAFDPEGNLLLAVWDSGLFKVELSPDRKAHVRRYKATGNSDLLNKYNQIYCLISKDKNEFWLGSEGGISIFNIKNETYQLFDPLEIGLKDRIVFSIYKSTNEELWTGSIDGLNYYNPACDRFHKLDIDAEMNESYYIQRIVTDKSGNIWFSTRDNGIYRYNGFTNITTSFNNRNESAHTYKDVFISDRGSIFCGQQYGIALFSADNNSFVKFFTLTADIRQFAEDKKENLWIATDRGLMYLDIEKKTIEVHSNNPSDTNTISKNSTHNVFVSNDGIVWSSNNRGIEKYNKGSKYFKHYQNGLRGFSGSVSCFFQFQDSANIWIGSDEGLYLFYPQEEKFIKYTTFNGLSSDLIRCIFSDNQKRLWIGTDYGLSRFDLKNKIFTNYYTSDGLPSNKILSAGYLNNNEKTYIGTDNGIFYFYPDSIRDNLNEAPVIITDIKLFNKTFEIGDNHLLKKHFTNTKEIILQYKQNVLTFEYSLLSYTQPGKNKFAYKMEGFEKDWNYVSDVKRANYTNLPPGKYIFRVKAANSDNIWSKKEAMLAIRVLPPFWQTWWFRILVIFIITGGVLSFYWIRMARIKRINRELEAKVAIRTKHIEMQKEELNHKSAILKEVNSMLNEQKEEITSQAEELRMKNNVLNILNATKDKFFSIIAHDLKNPFHGLLNFSDLLETNYKKYNDDERMEFVRIIKKSSEKAFDLLQNLLTWARSQTGRMPYAPEDFKVADIVQETFSVLEVLAIEKQIAFTLEDSYNTAVYADKAMITTVIRNLVNNAIKFTNKGGNIIVTIRSTWNMAFIEIKDNGTGMTEEDKNKLFRIDAHHTTQGTSGETGTGLGLILCHEFISKNKGSIRVESKIGEGTTFIIDLPQSEIKEIPDIKISEKNEPVKEPEIKNSNIISINLNEEEGLDEETQEKPQLLLIDDEADIRRSIKEILRGQYIFIEADNGEEGLNKALEFIPDLIISDIVMPRKDGITLCRELKSNMTTSHIPIILLTAKSTTENQVEGISTGADSYIIKPFNDQYLKACVKNLIENRRRLYDLFSKKLDITSKEITTTGPDEKFIEKAINLIGDNLSNADYSVETFSSDMGMSRSFLYKKLHAITGQTVSGFVMVLRLKEAAKLLSKKEQTASEIAYTVGFNSPQYFSRAFKKHFGVTPKDYTDHQS